MFATLFSLFARDPFGVQVPSFANRYQIEN